MPSVLIILATTVYVVYIRLLENLREVFGSSVAFVEKRFLKLFVALEESMQILINCLK